jgi:hypothetical protein
MADIAEILLEGSYLYYQDDTNYSQENFKLVEHKELQTYHLFAEILSRIETGEFLKILVRYEMNQHFMPYLCRIERSIGSKYSQEVFKFDLPAGELHYTFQNSQGTQEFTKSINSKHYLSTPAFSTTTLFSLSKKFDATGRTPIVLLSTNNDWSYKGPPEEKIIYGDHNPREVIDFIVNGNTLQGTLLRLYENDSTHASSETPVEFYLSKHFNLPYQMISGNQKIVIKNLKKN